MYLQSVLECNRTEQAVCTDGTGGHGLKMTTVSDNSTRSISLFTAFENCRVCNMAQCGRGARHQVQRPGFNLGTKAEALVDAPTHKCMKKTSFLEKERVPKTVFGRALWCNNIIRTNKKCLQVPSTQSLYFYGEAHTQRNLSQKKKIFPGLLSTLLSKGSGLCVSWV